MENEKKNYVEYAGGKNIDNSAKLQVDYSCLKYKKKYIQWLLLFCH